MKKGRKNVFYMLFYSGLILLFFLVMQPWSVYYFKDYIAVLFPKGIIGMEERNLLLIIQALMLLIIIPVYILTFVFSWKYRVQNTKAKYDPDLVDHTVAEIIWWGIPLVMTTLIGILTWVKTTELDPYKPLDSNQKKIHIQVVALQWKWLFIYPEEQIASVNFLQIPKNTPVTFEITSDAPMNSFWIPHLGGQIYAMPGMRTELNLIANEEGDFRGSSANISGKGFAGMHFVTRASSEEDFRKWMDTAKSSSQFLNWESYKNLALPSENNKVELYQLKMSDLFQKVIMKYMHPPG